MNEKNSLSAGFFDRFSGADKQIYLRR